MKSKHWLAFAAIIALGAAFGPACSGDGDETEDLCADVQCIGVGTTCDPSDGICKCGTGDDRIICKSNEICQTEPSPSCLQDRCLGSAPCERGETCDPTDGVCKCGATSCSEGEVCTQNRCEVPDPCQGRLCPEGQTCDSSDGACKCGGEQCAANERCDEGLCVFDPCKGVHCGGRAVCNPDDLSCHCGTVTGEACKSGESCNEVDGTFVCMEINPCIDVVCEGDAICDPNDGECRCGGVGTDYPICAEEQKCHDGECVGGNLCSNVVCAPGFVCDQDTGLCLCGDRLCAEGETCMAVSKNNDTGVETFECVQECEVFVPGACPAGNSCYVDLNIGATTGYCFPTGSKALGADCDLSHECEAGTTCFGVRTDPTCRLLCQPGEQGNLFCAPDFDICQEIPSTGIGICTILG